MKVSVLVAQSCPTLCDPVDCSRQAPLSIGFSRKNARVGCHALLQGIFPTQGSNLCLLHCRQILYHLSHQGKPRLLERVTYPFSRGLPDPDMKLGSPALQTDSLSAELPGKIIVNFPISLFVLRGEAETLQDWFFFFFFFMDLLACQMEN